MRYVILALMLMSPQAVVLADDNPYASLDEPHGVIRGDFSRKAEDIYPVQIRKVDGKEFPGKRNVMYLKPGERTITAFILADGLTSMDIRRGLRNDEPQTLTLEVEDGKTYQVGAKLNRSGREQWTIVLWKVE